MYFLPKVIPKICKIQIFVIEKSSIEWIHILTLFWKYFYSLSYSYKVLGKNPEVFINFQNLILISFIIKSFNSYFYEYIWMRVLHDTPKLHTNFEWKFLHKEKVSRKFLFKRKYFEILYPHGLNTFVSFIKSQD